VFRAVSLLLAALFTLNGCGAIVQGVISSSDFQGSYHMSRGEAFFQQRQYDAAVNQFTLTLQAKPNDYLALEYRAASYVMLRNYNAAIADLNRVEQVAPKHSARKFLSQIIAMRAYAEVNANDYAAATRDYTRLVQYQPKNAGLRSYLANELFKQDKVSEAIAKENEAINLAPHGYAFYNDRCFYKAATSALTSALADCNVALQHPQVPGLRLHTLSSRALVYVKLGQPAHAIADCNAAMHIAALDPDSLYLRGYAERQLHDAAAAQRDIAAAVAAKPALTTTYAVYHLQ
jgi:tetratricopeptide (TPR) repeat protein